MKLTTIITAVTFALSPLQVMASDKKITVNLKSENHKIESITAVYETNDTLVCGRFNDGSTTGKVSIKNYQVSGDSVEVDKQHGGSFLCKSLLRTIVVNANGGGFAYVDVVNKFNEDVAYETPRPTDDVFTFKECVADEGCEYMHPRMDINQSEMDIELK